MRQGVTYYILLLWVAITGTCFTAGAQELYKVKKLPGSNTVDKNEFCAVPYTGGIIFCTDKEHYSPIKCEASKQNRPLTNMFTLTGDTTVAAGFAAEFNSICTYNGPVVFYDNGKRAILTRTQNPKNKLKSVYKDTRLGLYFFEKQASGKWKEVAPFPYNNFTYSCGQAAINEQGTVLIFSSDMPGGNGGTDLYYSTFNEIDSGWTLPTNLGAVINSSKNEMFPFLHSSGTLYYSSAGKKGKGGLDVFHSIGGFPYSQVVREVDDINSEKDDFGFWASPDYSEGYLSSNRGGTDDIYSISLSYPLFTNCEEYKDVSYCFEFFEEASLNVDTIPMEYEWDFGDGVTKKGLSAYHCYSKPGTYVVQLNVFDTVLNALFMNEATYELEIEDKNQPLMEVPDSANPGKPFYVSAGQARFRDFVITEYYWNFGDGRQLKGERFPITMEEEGTYEVVLGVTSRPDKNGHSETRCFKRKLIVTNDTIAPLLVDDSSDPAYKKLPGGTQGTTYLVVEDEEGLHVTRVKGDGSGISDISTLPNSIFYIKLDENGDTLVKKNSTDADSRKLLESYLEEAEAPYEKKKNGLVSFNAFLPGDSVRYPVYGADIKKFYSPIDSMLNSFTNVTKLPNDLAKALLDAQRDETELNNVVNNNEKKYLPQYNTRPHTDDSTVVFYKQTTTDSTQADRTNTTQYDTRQYTDNTNNGNTNNVQNNTNQNNNVQNTTQNTNNQNTGSDTTQNTTNNTQNTSQNTNPNNKVDTTQNNVQNDNQNNTTQNTSNQNNGIDSTQNTTSQNNGVDTTQNTTSNTQNTSQNTNPDNRVDTTQNNTQNTHQNNTTTNNGVDTTQNATNQNNGVDTTQNANQNNSTNNNGIDTTQNANNNTQNTNNQNNGIDTTQNTTNNTQNTNNNNNTTQNTNNQNNTNQNNGTDTTQNNNNQNNTNQNNNTPTEEDTTLVPMEILLNFSHPELVYRVQIGAYRFPKNFKYQHLLPLGQKPEIETLGDGITRFTLGRFATLTEAYAFRDKVRAAGVLDTFVTAMYKGKRYYLSELRVILKDVVKPK